MAELFTCGQCKTYYDCRRSGKAEFKDKTCLDFEIGSEGYQAHQSSGTSMAFAYNIPLMVGEECVPTSIFYRVENVSYGKGITANVTAFVYGKQLIKDRFQLYSAPKREAYADRLLAGKEYEGVCDKIRREFVLDHLLRLESDVKRQSKYKDGGDAGSDLKGKALPGFSDGKVHPRLIAEDIRQDHIFITLKDTGEILCYNPENGLHEYGGEEIIKGECKHRYDTELSNYWLGEVKSYIETATYIDRKEVNNNLFLLHLKNGIFNIEEMKLRPFTSEIISTIALPIVYDTGADCPRIKRFFSEIHHERDIPIIEELLGFCLYRAYEIHKAFLLLGPGANGKSTELELIKHFLGCENIANIPLQDLDKNRFAKAELHWKLANISADLTDTAMARTGTFKMVTGNDTISAEKKFKSRFSFVSYAKQVFSCNKIPESRDDTNAFFRRWVIIEFPNAFIGDEADPKLLEKLITAEELSGLFNLSIEGLKRLLDKGQFSYSKNLDEVRIMYTRLSDSLKAFVEDRIVYDYDGWIGKDRFFIEYVAYCKEHGLKIKNKTLVGKQLTESVPATSERKRDGDGRVNAWSGIRFKNVVDVDENDEKEIGDYDEGGS